MSIAKALEPFDPKHYKDLITFYFISSGSTQDFRKSQKDSFSVLINQILLEALQNKQLRAGFSLETLSEMVAGICVSTLLNWSVEDNFPIVPKMKNAVKFINKSVFVEG